MNIQINQASLAELTRLGIQFPYAGSAALNRLARTARTRVSEEIRQGYNIKKKDIDPYIHIEKSTSRTLRAKVTMKRVKIALGAFLPRTTKRIAGIASKYGGVLVEVKKGNKQLIENAFVAKMRFGSGIFKRKGKGRGPVKFLYGPAAAELFGGKHIRRIIAELINTKFPDILRHEIQFRLNRANTTSSTGDEYGNQGQLLKRRAMK